MTFSKPDATSLEPDRGVFSQPTKGLSVEMSAMDQRLASTDQALKTAAARLVRRLEQAEDPFDVSADACSKSAPSFDSRTLNLLAEFRFFALGFQKSGRDPRLNPAQEDGFSR